MISFVCNLWNRRFTSVSYLLWQSLINVWRHDHRFSGPGVVVREARCLENVWLKGAFALGFISTYCYYLSVKDFTLVHFYSYDFIYYDSPCNHLILIMFVPSDTGSILLL